MSESVGYIRNMKNMAVVSHALIGLGLVLCLGLTRTAPYKVLCLGDSITYGTTKAPDVADGGYRTPLFAALGTQYVPAGSVSSFGLNEGHPSWLATTMEARADKWMADATPDVVIILAGTNDTGLNADNYAAVRAVEGIIEAAPKGKAVYVCEIPYRAPGYWVPPGHTAITNAQIDSFNGLLWQMVETHTSAGEPVHWVSIAWSVADLGSDGVHPSNAGYAKLASGIYVAMTN